MTQNLTVLERVPGCVKSWIGTLTGRRRAALAFGAGSLSVLSFAPVFCFPILFVTFPIFVWLIDSSATPRSSAWCGWWFGFGYFFFNLFWIGEAFLVEAEKFAWMLPFAITLLPAGLALFWALAAWVSRHLWPVGLARVLVLAVTLSVGEWLRGHVLTGLPWNVIGYALTYPLPLMQSAGLFGVYGLSLLAVAIFAAPVVILADGLASHRLQSWANAAAAGLLPILMLLGYGQWQLSQPQTFVDGVKIRIVQPNVLQTEKWRPEFQRRIFYDHLLLTATNASGVRDDMAGITHVIWPEAAMPFFPLEQPKALEEIATTLPQGRVLITGGLRRSFSNANGTPLPLTERKAFNSLMVFDDAGKLTASYDKIHLVPFGEYLPAEPVLSALGLKFLTQGLGVFSSGDEPRPLLTVAGLPSVLGLICYEVLFPGQIVQTSARPGVIINVTNDGWFGDSTGPRQHFYQTRVRAVEEGVPILRSANNGISGVIDRNGRVFASLGMNERGVIDSALPSAGLPPPYSKYGEALFVALLASFAGLAWLMSKKSSN